MGLKWRYAPGCTCCGAGVTCACCTGTNPSRLVLTISGVTGTDDCCTSLNNSFMLTQDSVDGCLWSYAEADSCTCDAVTYDLSIEAVMVDDPTDGCTITITVQVRDGANPPVVELVRSKVFGAAFDCCTIDRVELDPVSNTFTTCDCNEASLSTKLSAVCACEGCSNPVPSLMKLVLTGIQSSGSTNCASCASLTGTFILAFDPTVTGCRWFYDFGTFAALCTATVSVEINAGVITVIVAIQFPVAEVTTITFTLSGLSDPYACDSLVDEDIPHTSTVKTGANFNCETSSPTATLTAL